MQTVVDVTRDRCSLPAAGVLVLLASGLTSQSSIRGWGDFAFDTESRHGVCKRLVAAGDLTGVLRDDGRVFFQGPNTFASCEVPPAPPGLRYDDIATGGRLLGSQALAFDPAAANGPGGVSNGVILRVF